MTGYVCKVITLLDSLNCYGSPCGNRTHVLMLQSDELRRSFASYFIDAVIEMINKLNLVIIHDKVRS